MSAANNTSKSGSKSCSSPEEYNEEELVTWLQYPLSDSIEKGYCSDLFEQWPSSSASVAMPPSSVGASRIAAAASVSVGPCTFSENGSMYRSDCTPASCDSGNTDAKERVGSGSLSLRTSSVEGALALGAERAAGLVSLTGRDAFNKVRTSMQPPVASQLNPISTSSAMGIADQSLRSRPLASPGAFTSKLPPQLPQGRLNSPSKTPQSITNYGASASSSLTSAGKGALSNSMSFSSYRPRSLSEAPLKMPSTQDSGCSRITDEMSVQRASDHTSIASNRGNALIAHASGDVPARFTALPVEGRHQRAVGLGMSEIVRTSSSGRSLSGTTLSTREASSYSGKRKLEDSESRSEDVEGESSMDAKQPRKASSSKRNRAAEVHNLSERNRRNRINEKLKTLQDLIPNSSKTDKASVLDEAIEYMKTLQMQLQMVSIRSGLSVSPMMIPLGMPHLQMAPLHPVGLGVPIGHPGLGMGMGLHMSMGMGMVDMPQGMLARPPQLISAPANHFGMPFQGRSVTESQESSSIAVSHECSLDSTKMGSIPPQYMTMPQNFSQLSTPMHTSFHSLASTHHPQPQHEQWQPSGHRSEPVEHSHEQVVKED